MNWSENYFTWNRLSRGKFDSVKLRLCLNLIWLEVVNKQSKMEYTSPLGSNFRLSSCSTSNTEPETPKKPDSDFIPLGGNDNSDKKNFKWGSKPRWSSLSLRNSPIERSPRPGFGNRPSNNWSTPKQGNQHQRPNDPVPITQYYHPSMVEDPWKHLEQNS